MYTTDTFVIVVLETKTNFESKVHSEKFAVSKARYDAVS